MSERAEDEKCEGIAWKDARKHREPIWPLMGYAPGDYSFKCNECIQVFFGGDKRATNCLPCAIDGANRRAREVAAELNFTRARLNTLQSAIRIVREVEVE